MNYGNHRVSNKIYECKIDLKPMSINVAYLGKKIKSSKYRIYEKTLLEVLPEDLVIPHKTPLQIYIRWGFSSILSDWDNPIKPFQDILQTKYGFNDRDVYLGVVEKDKVPKGQEYIYFRITEMTKVERLRKFIKELFK